MNNPYTASFENIRELYVSYHRRRTLERFENWRRALTREQIEEQLNNGRGAIIDEINSEICTTGLRSENVEFICALQLADFYFPNAEKDVSFELRRDIDPSSIQTFEQLIEGFEDNTHIDCLVRSRGEEISFQLKRYREENNPAHFVEWLNARVLRHYGRMNGTSLVILLQLPNTDAEHPFALDELYDLFTREALSNVSFDTVSLMYNDGTNGYMTLHELHPRHHRTLIEMNLALARIRGDA